MKANINNLPGINLNSKVEYIIPFPAEVGVTFTVIEIEKETDWCIIRANLGTGLQPTYTANISDLQIAQ